MSKMKVYSISFYLEEGSDLERRIQALADQTGDTFEGLLGFLVLLGSWHRLEENVSRYELDLSRMQQAQMDAVD